MSQATHSFIPNSRPAQRRAAEAQTKIPPIPLKTIAITAAALAALGAFFSAICWPGLLLLSQLNPELHAVLAVHGPAWRWALTFWTPLALTALCALGGAIFAICEVTGLRGLLIAIYAAFATVAFGWALVLIGGVR